MIEIIDAKYKNAFKIEIQFNDKKQREIIIDFEKLITEGEIYQPLNKIDYFKKFNLNSYTGTIEWENGADFAPTFLYQKVVDEILLDFEAKVYSKKLHNTLAWDLCYNYFYDFYKNDKISEIASPENIENSCTRLGVYLASFEMYQKRMGKPTFLLENNYRLYEPLINYISNCDRKYWEIDVNNYSFMYSDLIKLNEEININLSKNITRNSTITQTTKIIMGIFGSVLGFDTNICSEVLNRKSKPSKLCEKDLKKILNFYNENKEVIDIWEKKLKTIKFDGSLSDINYTKARIIDIVGFQLGK